MATYRKVYIAVLCENDEEQQQAQRVAEDLSGIFRLSAKDLIGMYPAIKKNGPIIGSAFRTISTQGKSGLVRVLPQLINMKV